jgi:hypothetical protein
MSENWNERIGKNPTYYITAQGTDPSFRWDVEESFQVAEEETALFTYDT